MKKRLSKEAIEDLRLILQEDYGVDKPLSDDEVAEYGIAYIELGKEMLQEFKKMQRGKKEFYSTQVT